MKADRRSSRGLIGAVAVTAALWTNPGNAAADPITSSGSVSVVVPGTPEDMQFVLTVNGQDYDNSTVDNVMGGTLTLGWDASQQEPSAVVKDCPGKRSGRRISVQGATASTSIWATWVSPSNQLLAGPVLLDSIEGVSTASICSKPGGGRH